LERPERKNIAVVGIGNLLLSDDGVGVHVLHELEKRYNFPGCVELIDGGTMGLDLLPFLEGKDSIVFIDAVNFKKKAGFIGELINGEIPKFFSTKLSVHQIALPDMLATGRFLGTLTEDMCLIGIQPDNIETGYGLTPEIQVKSEELISRVVHKLSAWGADVTLQ